MDKKLTYELTYKDVIEILRMTEIPSMANLKLELEGLKLDMVFQESAARAKDAQSLHISPAAVKPRAMADAAVTINSTQSGVQEQTTRIQEQTTRIQEQTTRVAVRATLAGTFYRAPAPGAPPFVEVGQTVHEGDKLGLIELMKLFTPVTSPCSGIVAEICANNQELVDSDKVLIVIEPAAQ